MHRYLLTGVLMLCAKAAPAGAQPSSPWVWANGPSSAQDSFPIGVWLQHPARAERFRRDMHINTFVGQYQGASEAELAMLAAAEMPAWVDLTETVLQSPNAHTVQAWTHQDEPDNAQPDGRGGYLPCVDPAEIRRRYLQWKALDPTRPVFLNLGQGVANVGWRGRGTCTGKTEMYPEYVSGADIVSFDIYPATHSDPRINGRLELVARGLRNLHRWVRQSGSGHKIVMCFIGTTNIKSTTRSTSPEQIKSMVWMSLIHGSMGVLYFVHEWHPTFREDGIYNHPENVAAVADTNALITRLAPVLGGPDRPDAVSVSTDGEIATMVKRRDGRIYLFAVEMLGSRGVSARFTVRGVDEAVVRDLEEGGRELTMIGGRFTDTFDAEGYDAHVYEIAPR